MIYNGLMAISVSWDTSTGLATLSDYDLKIRDIVFGSFYQDIS